MTNEKWSISYNPIEPATIDIQYKKNMLSNSSSELKKIDSSESFQKLAPSYTHSKKKKTLAEMESKTSCLLLLDSHRQINVGHLERKRANMAPHTAINNISIRSIQPPNGPQRLLNHAELN